MKQENSHHASEPAPARTGGKIERRALLMAAGALIPGIAFARDYGPGAAPIHYPDPDVIVIDPRFKKYKLGNAGIKRLYTGLAWAEGPAWCSGGRYLVLSDIPNNVQMRWLDEDGHVSRLRVSNFSNGNTFDFQGRQVSC